MARPRKNTDKKTTKTPASSKASSSKTPSYINWIYGGITILLIGLLAFFAIKTITNNGGQITEESAQDSIFEGVYIVKSGDTLWSIAENELGSGHQWQVLAQLNNITEPYELKTGMRLNLPDKTYTMTQTSPEASPSSTITGSPTQTLTGQVSITATATITLTPTPTQVVVTSEPTKAKPTKKIAQGSGPTAVPTEKAKATPTHTPTPTRKPIVSLMKTTLTPTKSVPTISQAKTTLTGVLTMTPTPTQAQPTITKLTQKATVTPTIKVEPTQVKPTIQPEVPSQEKITGTEYTVVSGDTLWDISIRAYGDGYHWPQLAKDSGIENPDLIYPGDKVVISR